MTRFACAAAILCLLPGLAIGQSIGLPAQGRLLDSRDRPVTGRAAVLFALYPTPSGGTALWQEDLQVDFDAGLYSVTLGLKQPFPQGLFKRDELWLGIKVGDGAELSPRQKLSWVPYSVRSLESASVKGGVIEDSTITGGRIVDASIDATRVTAESIDVGAISTAEVKIGGRSVITNPVPLTGGTMTGPLAAPQLVSTATEGPPLQVASSARVDNLNADLLDGLDSSAFWTKAEFSSTGLVRQNELLDANHENLLNNGAFENFRNGDMQPPNWWQATGADGTAANGVERVAGFSKSGVAIRDSSLTTTVALHQQPFSSIDPSLQGASFTAAVLYKRESGTATGALCIEESTSPLGRTCTPLAGSGTWQRAAVTHTLTPSASFVRVLIRPTERPDETAAFVFDDAILVRGTGAPSFRASSRDAIPSGLIALFATECPGGWVRFGQADGRTLVGTRPGGALLYAQGAALANQGTRVITQVPAHTHIVNPPPHTTAPSGAHVHLVDPPRTDTSDAGTHAHGITTYNDDFNGRGGDYAPSWAGFDSPNSKTVTNTDASGNHKHSVDVLPFNSASAGEHAHTFDMPAFASESSGEASVDVTMPYLQVAICQSL